jgi:putative methionine-R-sulfoxide reductase with GAF domain
VLAARIDGDVAINLASAGYRGRTRPLDRAPLRRDRRRTRRPDGLTAWVERVDQDPEYFQAHPDVQTEVLLPLLEMGQVIGILELAFDRRTPRNEELWRRSTR